MEWLKEVSDKPLEQGSIILDFPLPEIMEFDVKENDESNKISVNITNQAAIIMTQSCDIINEKVNNIMLCPVYTLGQYIEALHDNGYSNKKIESSIDNMRKNAEYSKFLIDETSLCDIDDYLVVDFDSVVALPINAVKRIAKQKKTLVLESPYRERMAQNYAFFYMRIGYDKDIDRENLENRRKEIIQKLI